MPAGRNRDAVAILDDWRDAIPVADLGLALALAGEPTRGSAILADALRNGENTPKLRQNLAYAYALDGRWREARIMMMQDVPADQPPGLAIAAVPVREDAHDAFCSRDFASFDDLPLGARFGTASLRRQAQALALRPDLNIEMLRGNVDTRLRRLNDGEFDAILLATAGLNRLGFGDVIRERLSVETFLPAPGQGALALQTREADLGAAWVAALNDPTTALCVAAERGAMRALEGSCHTAIGAHATVADGKLSLAVEMLAPDGSARWRRNGVMDGTDPAQAALLGERLGAEIHAAAGDQRFVSEP